MLIQQNKLCVMACYMEVVRLISLTMIFLYKYFYFYNYNFDDINSSIYTFMICHRYSLEDGQRVFKINKYDFAYLN